MTTPEPGSARASESADVDYRFLLANERTFLAWMRTSLALVAGGVALDQFVRVGDAEGAVVAVAMAAIVAGGVVAVLGTIRWSRTDLAMRTARPLPRSSTLLVVGVLFAALAAVVALLLLVT